MADPSLCSSLFEKEVHSGSPEKAEGSIPSPLSGRGVCLHRYNKLLTVAGGAPLLEIEKDGPLAFLLEQSKAILRRVTGHQVIGREPFSMLLAADIRPAPASPAANWTDFFLEPGKTQLLECVRRLRTQGTSFSLELPYERSDAEIRYKEREQTDFSFSRQ